MGYGDHCKCFTCQGLLNDFQEDEDIWKTHCWLYPECPFMNLSRGAVFIRDVHFEKRLPQYKKLKEAKKLNEDFELTKDSTKVKNCIVCSTEKENDKAEKLTLCVNCIREDKENRKIVLETAKKAEGTHRCIICLDNKLSVLFLPCSHILACPNCSLSLKDCALCRTPIQCSLKVFFP